jgi:hypothetical protein
LSIRTNKGEKTDSPYRRQLEITEALKPKFDKAGVLGSTLRKRSRNLSSARNKQKSSGKKNVAEDAFDESEVEGSDRHCIYYKEKYSETKRSDGWTRSRKCEIWGHESCTGWPEKALDYFECSHC